MGYYLSYTQISRKIPNLCNELALKKTLFSSIFRRLINILFGEIKRAYVEDEEDSGGEFVILEEADSKAGAEKASTGKAEAKKVNSHD